ncbi:hypothetical protein SMMN14_05558 [Sphaerulina musiva]
MATDATGTGLFEDLLPPLHEVSPRDHGAYILIAAVIFMILSGLTTVVKLYATAHTFRRLRVDDVALVAALVFALLYTVVTCESVKHGLGRSAENLTVAQTRSAGQYFLAANVLSYPSLASSKCSVAFLVISIQPRRWIVTSLYGLCAVVVVWAIVAICVTALQCGPDRWVLGPDSDNTCIDQYAAQLALSLVDIFTDVGLVILPVVMVASVQFSIWKRFIVSFMFGLRILVPVFIAINLAYQARFYDKPTPDRTFAAVMPSVWTSIALHVSLITACLPALKRFLLDFGAGVANGLMGEAFELQQGHMTKQSQGQSSMRDSRPPHGARPHLFSRSSRSRVESNTRRSDGKSGGTADRTSGELRASAEGSTDGILQTRDYQVRYEAEDLIGTAQ